MGGTIDGNRVEGVLEGNREGETVGSLDFRRDGAEDFDGLIIVGGSEETDGNGVVEGNEDG